MALSIRRMEPPTIYWANTTPGTAQVLTPIPIPSADYGHYSFFKLTRNNQAANQVVVQIQTYSNSRYYGYVATNSMGSSSYLGTKIQTGMELRGRGTQTNQSSGGDVHHIYNQWQTNDGYYHYQAYGDDIHNVDPYTFGPPQAAWITLPQDDGTGGDLYTYCYCQ